MSANKLNFDYSMLEQIIHRFLCGRLTGVGVLVEIP